MANIKSFGELPMCSAVVLTLLVCCMSNAQEKDSSIEGTWVVVSAPANEKRATPITMDKPAAPRRFRMGFTGFVYDITPEAVAASRKFCRENGDILAHHIEGVPWAEALAGTPFPPAFLEEWAGKKSATP